MKFEDKYFSEFSFTKEQAGKNFSNALKDLKISKQDKIPEVKFNYAYTALIKAGIALLSFHKMKVKNVPGHHIKIIEKISELLEDGSIYGMADSMRQKRNLDLYSGGIEVTQKECREYIEFVDSVIVRIKRYIEG
jgi:hypothetical protein